MIRFAALAVFLLAVPAHAAESCWYQTEHDERASYEACATVEGGRLVIAPEHLKRLHFDKNGLADIVVNRQNYYVKRDGSSLAVITYDNGPDDFSEGLTRSLVDGKIAYFDRAFRMVIPPLYDWGWPFEKGRAVVCSGCRPGEPVFEHTPIKGGVWGEINKKGVVVVPLVERGNGR